jgi:DNA-binding transcriptional MerR regulator
LKSEPEFLSLPKLLQAAQESGLEVNERTLLYYVARGLLPKGQRSPYNGADGRVAYWPAPTLKRLRRILQLKQQGYKLEQIRKALESGRPAAPGADTDDWKREVAIRYLKNFVAGDFLPARLELEAGLPPADADESAWLPVVREYKTACLVPLIGEEPARHWVKQFFLQLHPKEVSRFLTQFRQHFATRPALSALPEQTRTVRRVVTDMLLGRLEPATFQLYLDAQGRAFQHALAKLEKASGTVVEQTAAALREACASLDELGPAAAEKGDCKPALARYAVALERLRVCSEVEAQMRWLEQF